MRVSIVFEKQTDGDSRYTCKVSEIPEVRNFFDEYNTPGEITIHVKEEPLMKEKFLSKLSEVLAKRKNNDELLNDKFAQVIANRIIKNQNDAYASNTARSLGGIYGLFRELGYKPQDGAAIAIVENMSFKDGQSLAQVSKEIAKSAEKAVNSCKKR